MCPPQAMGLHVQRQSRKVQTRRSMKISFCFGQTSSVCRSVAVSFASTTNISPSTRICTCRSRGCVTLLHASSSTHVLRPLQHILPARCPRWISCEAIQAIHHIRWCSGYGYRSLYDRMSVGVLELRLAPMVYCVPGIDQLGSGQPLHAHVCNTDYGWCGSEP